MITLQMKTSSLERAIGMVYDRLRSDYGDHRVFRAQFRSVEIVTNCIEVFTYIFDVTEVK